MLKRIFLVGLFAGFAAATSALAESQNQLHGAWIVDAKTTENRIINSPLPKDAHKVAEWFGLASAYMCAFTYEFDGDKAIVSAYGGAKDIEYQLISHQGSEFKYAPKNATNSNSETMMVSILNDRNIRIVHSNSPEMSYLFWKHGQLKKERATQDEVKAATDNWIASVQHIVEFLNASP